MKETKNQPTHNNSVSSRWTITLSIAFCFMLYAQDSKSNDSQRGDSEVNIEKVFEQKISENRQ